MFSITTSRIFALSRNQRQGYGLSVDIFSFGAVIYKMLSGETMPDLCAPEVRPSLRVLSLCVFYGCGTLCVCVFLIFSSFLIDPRFVVPLPPPQKKNENVYTLYPGNSIPRLLPPARDGPPAPPPRQ
jgi:serine/threonine protein kinase